MGIKVKAKDLGYYGYLREPGHVFEIEKEEHFSKRWMEKVSAKKAKQLEEDETEASEQSEESGSESVI